MKEALLEALKAMDEKLAYDKGPFACARDRRSNYVDKQGCVVIVWA